MDLGLSGKTALVTGASRGIGRAIALGLAAEGVNVVLNGLNPEGLAAAAKEVAERGVRAVPLAADVSDPRAVEEMFGKVKDLFGRLDILVNNAGFLKAKPLLDLSCEEWRKSIDVNLTSVFLCSKSAAPLMKDNGGVIINAASYAAVIPSIKHAAYAAAKAGVVSMTRTMAGELAPLGIRVVCYIPGVIETDLTAAVRAEKGKALVSQIALQRYGRPEEVADLVVFLSSRAAGYITGVAYEVSGGKLAVQNPADGWY